MLKLIPAVVIVSLVGVGCGHKRNDRLKAPEKKSEETAPQASNPQGQKPQANNPQGQKPQASNPQAQNPAKQPTGDYVQNSTYLSSLSHRDIEVDFFEDASKELIVNSKDTKFGYPLTSNAVLSKQENGSYAGEYVDAQDRKMTMSLIKESDGRCAFYIQAEDDIEQVINRGTLFKLLGQCPVPI